MTYHSVKKKQTPRIVYFGVVLFILAGVIFSWVHIRGALASIFVPFAESYGISTTFVGRAVVQMDTTLTSKHTLGVENAQLRLNVERLENELAENMAHTRELEDVVTLATSTLSPVLVMYPLVTDYSRLYSSILLSKGFKSGISLNDIVYLRGRQAVCTIIEVRANSSLCKLFSAYDEQTEAVVGGTTLFMKGNGGSSFVAEVTKDQHVEEGAVVYLKRDQTLSVGIVTQVDRDPQSAFWKIYVRGMYNPLSSMVFYTSK
jgi:cell shape-determining protein MreC